MDFHVLTIFPEMFDSPFSSGLISKAVVKGLVRITYHDIRNYATDPHKSVDDYPFGGGPGMVMKPEPIFLAVDDLRSSNLIGSNSRIIAMSPQGRMFDKNIDVRSIHVSLVILKLFCMNSYISRLFL